MWMPIATAGRDPGTDAAIGASMPIWRDEAVDGKRRAIIVVGSAHETANGECQDDNRVRGRESWPPSLEHQRPMHGLRRQGAQRQRDSGEPDQAPRLLGRDPGKPSADDGAGDRRQHFHPRDSHYWQEHVYRRQRWQQQRSTLEQADRVVQAGGQADGEVDGRDGEFEQDEKCQGYCPGLRIDEDFI